MPWTPAHPPERLGVFSHRGATELTQTNEGKATGDGAPRMLLERGARRALPVGGTLRLPPPPTNPDVLGAWSQSSAGPTLAQRTA